MTVLRARPSAQFARIAPAGFRILAALDGAAQQCQVDLEITCGTDSHAAPDPHVTGEAYDVSVQTLTPAQIGAVHAYLQGRLGGGFTVLYERPDHPVDPRLNAIAYVNPKATGPHMHIQRKKGTVFPPLSPAPTAA